MEKFQLIRIIHLVVVLLLSVLHSSSGGLGANPKCQGGYYIDASGTCTLCASPPNQHSTSYNIYCEGLCVVGYWGLNCDHTCGQCVNGICKRWTGQCIHMCLANYHGPTCEILCPNCNGCNEEGICTCSRGYHGNRCQETCPANCEDNTCSSDGQCDQGCKHRWVGDRCDIECARCDYLNSVTCQQGWFGLACDQPCREQCDRGICDRDGRCTEGCSTGLWGSRCESPCPKYCAESVCDVATGMCQRGCESGKHGDKCEEDCPQSCVGGCLEDGLCVSCSPGYYGTTCSRRCPGCETCSQDSLCLTCPVGYFGHHCNLECKNCLDGCSIDGRCEVCRDGWHGDSCSSPCSPGCGQEVGSGCFKQTGYCKGGCKDGWYDFRCDRKCPSGCNHGRCGPEGTCEEGCRMTVYGTYCNNTCSSNCIDSYCDVSVGSQQLMCQKGCHEGKSGFYCQDDELNLHPLLQAFIVVCIMVAFVTFGLCLYRKFDKRRNRRRWYLTPLSYDTTVRGRANISLATGASLYPIMCQPEAEIGYNGDVLGGYEEIGSTRQFTISGGSINARLIPNGHHVSSGLKETEIRQEPGNELQSIRRQDLSTQPINDQQVTGVDSSGVPDGPTYGDDQIRSDIQPETHDQPTSDSLSSSTTSSNKHVYFAIPDSHFEESG